MNHNWRYGSTTDNHTKHRTLLARNSNVICNSKKNFKTLVYWSLLRLQKQSRLLGDRTILHFEEQLWTITEDTEVPHLYEASQTTSSTQQSYMQIQEKNCNTLVYWSLLRLQKQSRLLCGRTIRHFEEQLWTITEDTEAPHTFTRNIAHY